MGTAKFHTDEGDVSSCETKLHANEVFATNNMIISADLGQVRCHISPWSFYRTGRDVKDIRCCVSCKSRPVSDAARNSFHEPNLMC